MGNGMENRLNFSDDVKQELSQNAMTEETARKFLLENGVPKEQVDAHISSLKSLINGQKSRTREHALDALLTLYSYISGKGFALYDTPFVNSSEKNNSTNVPSQTENISTTPVVNSPDKTANTPQKEEKKTEDASISQGTKNENTDKKTQTKSEPKVTIVQETNRTYDESLPVERQKTVREYFANRGNETITVKWKEVKIATLLAGNALKDGKIGDATRALEEKMKAEKKSPEMKMEKVDSSMQNWKTETQQSLSENEEVQIVIEESLTETYDDPILESSILGKSWEKTSSSILSFENSESAYDRIVSYEPKISTIITDSHDFSQNNSEQNPHGIPQNGTYVNGFSGNLGNNVRVETNASGQIYYDKQNQSVTIKDSNGNQSCVGMVCTMVSKR